MKLIRIKAVHPLEGYNVRLDFNDGTQKTIDLEPYLHGPIFESLRKDLKQFQTVKVDERMGTIVWQNGADMDPDVLYHGLKPAWMESESSTYKTEQNVQKVAEAKPDKPPSKR